MAARPKRSRSESQLRVLQQAMASAIHEFAQPLNVMQLLAENAQDDIAIVIAAAAKDPALLEGLARRLRSMVEQSERASEIARHIRAFAIDVGTDKPAFDVNQILRRITSLLSTDLKSMGAELSIEPSTEPCGAAGDDVLLMFALTECVLRFSRSPRPGTDAVAPRRIRLSSREASGSRRPTVVLEAKGVAAPERAPARAGAAANWLDDLPMLTLLGNREDTEVTVDASSAGTVRIGIVLPTTIL